MIDSPRQAKHPVLALATSHWVAMLGMGLVLTALATMAFLAPVKLRHGEENPYIGLASIVVPLVLLVGVVITPLGLWLGRARLRQRMQEHVFDRRGAVRKLLLFFAVTALINVGIGTQVTYRAVHHMESRGFCGSCHVMAPESAAFEAAPHAGLLCVDCHVGSGAEGWIHSKIQGTRQLLQVLTDRVPRPIHSAIAAGRMVTSSETCEQCHWKAKPVGARVRVLRTYGEDEENTPETTVLTMLVGGAEMGGIHGSHFGPGVQIRFVAADANRQDIPLVEYSNSVTGEQRTYVRAGSQGEAFAASPRITMECVDCHNRVAHTFLPADKALDQAITLGRISSSLPYLKKKGLELLEKPYETREAAAAAIPAALEEFYKREHAETWAKREADVREAAAELAEIHARYVFPELAVTWNTYPDNRGHQTFPGCFRCHEGNHATEKGEKISSNCFHCHSVSAMEDVDPEILDSLGVTRLIEKMRKK